MLELVSNYGQMDPIWERRVKRIGMGVGVAGIGLTLVTVPFVIPALRKYCLPFIPATDVQVRTICDIMKKKGGVGKGTVIDLGSGDGRVVIALAKQGHYAVGCELNYWLVLISRIKALLNGVGRNTEFHSKDLWQVDLSKYETIIFFGVDQMMHPLGEKIKQEAMPTATILSSRFKFPQWVPCNSYELGSNSVWVYHMTDNTIPNK